MRASSTASRVWTPVRCGSAAHSVAHASGRDDRALLRHPASLDRRSVASRDAHAVGLLLHVRFVIMLKRVHLVACRHLHSSALAVRSSVPRSSTDDARSPSSRSSHRLAVLGSQSSARSPLGAQFAVLAVAPRLAVLSSQILGACSPSDRSSGSCAMPGLYSCTT